jgi:hypothetical protein
VPSVLEHDPKDSSPGGRRGEAVQIQAARGLPPSKMQPVLVDPSAGGPESSQRPARPSEERAWQPEDAGAELKANAGDLTIAQQGSKQHFQIERCPRPVPDGSLDEQFYSLLWTNERECPTAHDVGSDRAGRSRQCTRSRSKTRSSESRRAARSSRRAMT